MPDDPLVALALRLTDGESIDWKAESQSGSVDLSLLQMLKQIEAVARAHEAADTPIQGDGGVAPTIVRSSVLGATWKSLSQLDPVRTGTSTALVTHAWAEMSL